MYCARSGSPGRRHGLGVVAGLCANVDWHRRNPILDDWRRAVSPALEEILAFCCGGPRGARVPRGRRAAWLGRFAAVEDDGRLTALCHVGANVVPAGEDCGRSPSTALRGRARMIIGEQRSVDELWAAIRGDMPAPRRRSSGQPACTRSSSRRRRVTPACARRRTRTSTCCCRRAQLRTRRRSGSIRSMSIPRASGGGRAARSTRGDRGCGSRTGSSCSRRRRPRGRRRGARSSRCGSTRSRAATITRSAECANLVRLLLNDAPAVCLFVRPENAAALRVYEAIGMQRVLTYRSLIF